jgi:hypothetical protein
MNSPHHDLDHELKNTLRREEPSSDFTARVMARIQAAPERKPNWGEALRDLFRLPALRWASAAALCLLVIISTLAYRHHEQTLQERAEQEGERARAQVLLALRITSSKLNVALREVRRADEPARERTNSKSEKQLEHL